MIRIKSEPINISTFGHIRALETRVQQGIRRGFYLLGKKLVRDTKLDILRKPRYGRLYIIRTAKTRRKHRASVPGEAPASRTGRLWKSLDFKVKGSEQLEFGYNSGVNYGKFLELGTIKMKARPGLKINIKRNQSDGRDFIEKEIKSALR